MKPALLFLFFLLFCFTVFAQATQPIADDGFGSPAVALVLLACMAIVFGAFVVGAIIAGLILGAGFLMATAGVLSAGVLVGLYQRSITAGFKTVTLIGGSLTGLVIGAGGFYAINRLAHLHFSPQTALLAGAGSGLPGGLLVGLIVFTTIRALLRFLKQKLAF